MHSIKPILLTQLPNGHKVATLELDYPRSIHAELLTHKRISRNSASSRAIPSKSFIKNVKTNPFKPKRWFKSHKGMSTDLYYSNSIKIAILNSLFSLHRLFTIGIVRCFNMLNVSKQITNRLLEPHSHIKVLITCDVDELLRICELRSKPNVEYNFRMLALDLIDVLNNSMYIEIDVHLPYVEEEMLSDKFSLNELCLISAARCARISYRTNSDLKKDYFNDLKLAHILASEQHYSPFEHQLISVENKEAIIHLSDLYKAKDEKLYKLFLTHTKNFTYHFPFRNVMELIYMNV